MCISVFKMVLVPDFIHLFCILTSLVSLIIPVFTYGLPLFNSDQPDLKVKVYIFTFLKKNGYTPE